MTPPFIIAEIAAAHNGSIERAFKLIDAADEADADAVKFQTWSQMAAPGQIIESGPWAGREMTDLYDEARTPWEWHERLFAHAKKRGLVPISTPFDKESVDFLAGIGCGVFKIASCEITDLSLIRYTASKAHSLIISTGMATQFEIDDALAAALDGGAKHEHIALMKCSASYPAPSDDFNLATLADMRGWGCDVGLSDHSIGSAVAVAAVALGAKVIEKHIGLDTSGVDGGFVTLPADFAAMVDDCRAAARAIGAVSYGAMPSEASTYALRRSLWITADAKAGDEITEANVRTLRPNKGISAALYGEVLGRKFTQDVVAGTPLAHHLLTPPLDKE